ncbi:hypothetical protein M1513_00270 [Patescibacteria group bacterium]|nr:hypothetical protein [Patescibacteria group bacterium]MCL5733311.1 hypothetical protein [Patescibacteria group bacterium]
MHKHRIIGIALLILALSVGLYIFHIGFQGLGVGKLSLGNIFVSPVSNLRPATSSQTQTSSQPSQPISPPEPTPNYTAAATSSEPQISTSEIPTGFTRKELSPYFQEINIGNASPNYGDYAQISIQSYNLPQTEKVDITGWAIKWNTGKFVIPQGVALYDPSGWETPSDINLFNNSTVNIYSIPNSLGVNFEINKCIGYLANRYQFTPELPSSCPTIDSSEFSNLSGDCQNYIDSINGSCQEPGPNLPFTYNDPSCSNVLNKFNYTSCFNSHRNDLDFLTGEWRIWNAPLNFDQSHDNILLFDKNGLLVSQYQY